MHRLLEINDYDDDPLLGDSTMAPEAVISHLQSFDANNSSCNNARSNPIECSPEYWKIHNLLMSMDSPELSPRPSSPSTLSGEVAVAPLELPASIIQVGNAGDTSSSTHSAITLPTSVGLHARDAGPATPTPYRAKSRKVAHRSWTCDASAEGVDRKPHFAATKPPIDDKLHEKDAMAAKEKMEAVRIQKRMLEHNRRQGLTIAGKPKIVRHVRERGVTWAQLRYYRCVHFSTALRKDSGVRGAFLTNDMHKTLGRLVIMAINEVVCTEINYLLPTANAPLWTLALAQEAWRRRPGNEGWSTDSQDAAFALSWEGMEALYYGNRYQEAIRGATTYAQETRRDVNGTELICDDNRMVRRTVVSHSLGHSSDEIKKKMECLHALLIAAGDKLEDGSEGGLHKDIRNLRRPVVQLYGQPAPSALCLANSKKQRIENHSAYGTNKATKN